VTLHFQAVLYVLKPGFDDVIGPIEISNTCAITCFPLIMTVFYLENPQRLLDIAYLESDVVPRIVTEWFDIGLFLEIPDDDLDNIKQLTNPCGRKCIDMLGRWIKRSAEHPNRNFHPTWRSMYNAMIAIDYLRPAEEMKEDLMNSNNNS